MSHKHHSCDCEHENVKYCKKCKVVYCLECNTEWKNYPNWTYAYNSPNYTLTSTGMYQAQAQNINKLDDGHNLNIALDPSQASCSHEAQQ